MAAETPTWIFMVGGRWDRCGGDLDWRKMWRKRNKEDKEGKQEEVKLDEEKKEIPS